MPFGTCDVSLEFEFCLHKNLPNGLKVSLELFRVRDFNRVDRVEHVEMGELNH